MTTAFWAGERVQLAPRLHDVLHYRSVEPVVTMEQQGIEGVRRLAAPVPLPQLFDREAQVDDTFHKVNVESCRRCVSRSSLCS